MGNSSTKESRGGDATHRSHHSALIAALDTGQNAPSQSQRGSTRRNRVSRGDLGGILGLGTPSGSGSHGDQQPERRETRQEREARRLERERIQRLAERERSMKEEHIDGGYLVTMGTYVGPEDFNKQIVRQLMIERKIAPFWRGLNDFSDKWAEHQLIAAARGLPVPAADEIPPDDLIPRPLPVDSPLSTTPTINNLTVPMGGRTQSTASDYSASNPGSTIPSPIASQVPRTSSPFKPRGKALAAVLGGTSRNGSTTEIVPREINLPYDPFVNGQPLEVFLYKEADECPICFLSYPPYLNHTRCCDQAICSECFVQIKRPDPHFPEGHNENDPNHNPEESAGLLVSEPACCPYCTQPDFGVTYDPPPFRRGLAYGISPSALGSMGTAMSSSSSLNSGAPSPVPGSPLSAASRRRAQSLAANAPNVILTDRIRPEWATKLQNARAHLARRAAAATALHTAAFLMNSSETRSSRSRFSRRGTVIAQSPSAASPGGAYDAEHGDSGPGTPSQGGLEPGPRGASAQDPGNRRSRLEDLEEMMFAEAVRLSLASEDERKRKEEKESEKERKKEAKKREKEDRKAAKAVAKAESLENPGGRSGQSSASGSSLSLPGLGFGRKRGNSGASNLRVEASVASAMATGGPPSAVASDANTKDKGKAVDRGLSATPGATSATVSDTSAPRPIPSPLPSAGPSHLRQMSSASSVSSSLLESQPGSFVSNSHLQDPRSSGLSLGASEDDETDRDPSTSTEPMFNFRSLAEVVGVTLEGENAGRRLSRIEAEKKAKEAADSQSSEDAKADGSVATEERVENASPVNPVGLEQSISTIKPASPAAPSSPQAAEEASSPDSMAPPQVTITPDTPANFDEVGNDSKRLGYETTVEHTRQVTQ
ncbi:hypothetical protein OQA88_7510 [Cercophora sp. LCS_1]